MMSVNGTLFIQMFHFAIAYWALTRFLFMPVVRVILHEQEIADKLQASVQELQEALESNEQSLLEHWRQCREYLLLKNIEQSDSVDVLKKEFSIQGPTAEDMAFSKDQELVVAQALVARIVQKGKK